MLEMFQNRTKLGLDVDKEQIKAQITHDKSRARSVKSRLNVSYPLEATYGESESEREANIKTKYMGMHEVNEKKGAIRSKEQKWQIAVKEIEIKNAKLLGDSNYLTTMILQRIKTEGNPDELYPAEQVIVPVKQEQYIKDEPYREDPFGDPLFSSQLQKLYDLH